MSDTRPPTDTREVERQAAHFRESLGTLREEIGRVIVGQRNVIDGVLTCMLAGSHALLEGVPGLGKTMLVRTLSKALGLSFSRIQFTPDLMPADVIGTTVIDEAQGGGNYTKIFNRSSTFIVRSSFSSVFNW